MFLLFGFDDYYPSGGWNDFVGSFNTLKEAQNGTKVEYPHDQYQVVDNCTKNVVWRTTCAKDIGFPLTIPKRNV